MREKPISVGCLSSEFVLLSLSLADDKEGMFYLAKSFSHE